MIKDFYYKIGPVETTKVWVSPIDAEKVISLIEDIKKLDWGEYQVYLGGKYVIYKTNTHDVDIMVTGPIYDYMKLYDLFVKSYDLALNKWNFFVDIKHFDNLEFIKYEKTKEARRFHIQTELAGEEIKIMDGNIVHKSLKETLIPNGSEFIPKEMAVNVVIWPMDKHIERGIKMPIIKLI